jgi:alanine dehydrogenase
MSASHIPSNAQPAAQLTLGVMGRSRKENEHRLPLHPMHLQRVPADLRGQLILEEGYGQRFGVPDSRLAPSVGAILPRAQLVEVADVVLLPKPQLSDLHELREGQVLWGWPHCVQDPAVTQVAIDKRLTLIAFEAMNHWTAGGGFGLHVFHKNNELAGYCSVIHAMQLAGLTGDYGRRLSATVIGFGATARGAVTALNAHGVHDVRVLTGRGVAAVSAPIHSARIHHFDQDTEAPHLSHVTVDEARLPIAPFLAESDIIVNCTLQDPNAPLTYLVESDLALFRPGSLVVDVSCDQKMGFGWATPTSFDVPVLELANDVRYYAVDHTPSYLWDSATWENSEALLPFLRTVLSGPDAWAANETVSRAVEIRDGHVVNPAILDFQHRGAAYPHEVAAAALAR